MLGGAILPLEKFGGIEHNPRQLLDQQTILLVRRAAEKLVPGPRERNAHIRDLYQQAATPAGLHDQ